MIRLDAVSVTYPGADIPTLRAVDLHVAEGELCLVVGPTGAGKTTLLKTVSGLVPHFSGGLLEGRVTVAGRDTRTHRPRDLADVVGVVLQDPAQGFVADTVEDELVYAMEQLGLGAGVMRARLEETLDLLGLESLRRSPVHDLSGGEQQRVAIGAVLTVHPRVLVLDEPTSALDPAAAEDVLAALTRLVHDLGLTVLVAEHRLERVVQYADRVVEVAPDGRVRSGSAVDVMRTSLVAPPIVDLGRVAGWDPLPLSVRDARRGAASLRDRLAAAGAARRPEPAPAGPAMTATGLDVRYPTCWAVRGVDLQLRAGEVAALMGRNGAGKSSLLWALAGAGRRTGGQIRLADGSDPAELSAAGARRRVALVPQNPFDLLYLPTVAAECRAADEQVGAPEGSTADRLAQLAGPVDSGANPRDLSEGQRLALVLAVQLSANAVVLLLDEPTRGLDYTAKRRLAEQLRRHAALGGSVLLSSHDVEFVAECVDRVVVLAGGEVVADGTALDVLTASPTFAPQVAKVMHPVAMLTVAEVSAALEEVV